jgi:RNA polymerase sigma-70 factor (ECF subfamily)
MPTACPGLACADRTIATDAELLDAWRTGDRAAGRALVDRHFAAIHRFFHNKVTSGVQDLVQRTFLGCVEGRERFRGESSFRGWLFGIAHNVLRMHIREKHGEPDPTTASFHDLAPSPSSVLVAKAEQRLVLAALRRLPLDYQIALELFFWEHMTGPEIAHVLGVPEGTVRTRLRRGRLALAQLVKALAESPGVATSTIDCLDGWAMSVRAKLGSLPCASEGEAA